VCQANDTQSDDFFNQLPEEERNKPELIRPAPVKGDRNYIARGYSPPGKEKINQNNYTEDAIRKAHEVKDARESFDMGADVGVPAIREPNVWPAEELLPGFKDFCMEFFWTCNKVGMDLFRAVAIGLGLDQEYFVSYHEDADHIFRLQHYPAVEKQALVDGTKARVVPHSDYGSMTLLFQDAVGGLQVEHAKHKGLYSEYCLCLAFDGETSDHV
jgi:isopenicillin N synthase-like dioxygenase